MRSARSERERGTYSGEQERKERGVVPPSDAIVDPLTMMIAAVHAVVALQIIHTSAQPKAMRLVEIIREYEVIDASGSSIPIERK